MMKEIFMFAIKAAIAASLLMAMMDYAKTVFSR